MSLIQSDSLSRTLDAVNAALFEGRTIPAAERQRVTEWIAARQGLAGAYADTFAGFPEERQRGIVVFTGERFSSASARHILGEEACRALRLLKAKGAARAALARADVGLAQCLERAARDPRNRNPGVYCCGKCTVALWRHLLAGGLDRRDERLRRGIQALRERRDGASEWRAMPFWYTVLALAEMDSPDAAKELRYAAPVLERALERRANRGSGGRRQELARRALARI